MFVARGQVLVGTGKHRLRLYDVRAQRRPALDVEFGSARVTALAVEPSGARAPCQWHSRRGVYVGLWWVGVRLGQA